APPAPPGSTIAGREPFEIADLMQQMRTTIGNVNDTIDLLKGDVQHAVQSITETVENANELIDDLSADVKAMATSGARFAKSTAPLAENIRRGEGTIGKMINADQLYQRAVTIPKSAEAIATDTQRV